MNQIIKKELGEIRSSFFDWGLVHVPAPGNKCDLFGVSLILQVPDPGNKVKNVRKPESLIPYVADRKGHDMRYAIDSTKIHNEHAGT